MSGRKTTGRIVAVDITRALAILGMIAVHSLYAYDSNGEPTLSYTLSAGKASAAFAVLAGVSISFIVGRKRLAGSAAPGKIASLLVRAGLIGAIGLLLGYTDGSLAVVILPYYALMFALAIPMAALSTLALAITTSVLFIAMPVVSQLVRPHVVEGLPHQLDFAYLFTAPAEFASDILLTGQFPALVWMAYIGVGLLIGRCRLDDPSTLGYIAGIGVALVFVSSFVSWTIGQVAQVPARLAATTSSEYVDSVLTFGSNGSVPTNSWWWLTVDTPHTGTTFDLMSTTGYTMIVLGGLLALERALSGRAKRVFDVVTFPLAAAGTMALTVYAGHIVWINSPLDVVGPATAFWLQVIVIGLLAVVWAKLFTRGPLEGVVTSATKFSERQVNQFRKRRKGVKV